MRTPSWYGLLLDPHREIVPLELLGGRWQPHRERQTAEIRAAKPRRSEVKAVQPKKFHTNTLWPKQEGRGLRYPRNPASGNRFARLKICGLDYTGFTRRRRCRVTS